MATEKPKASPKVTPKSVAAKKRQTTKSLPVAKPAIKFEQFKLSFGTVKEDSVVVKQFSFTNTGKKELLILDVFTACSCTVPTAPKEPILPGGKGIIEVKFTAKNRFGPQNPVVTVVTNAEPSTVKLFLEGWVEQIPGGVKE